jgi:uncharacterized protein (DUF1330 family)
MEGADMWPLLKRFSLALLLGAAVPAASVVADTLDDYLSLVTGSFDSSAQAATDARYDNALWHTVEIWDGAEGARWTYSENWLEGMQQPYRQRINRYRLEGDGSIVVDSYPVPDAGAYVGAWESPGRFAALAPEDLSADINCPARIARTGRRRFEGGTTGQRCRNNYRGAAYLVSHSVADENGLSNWDRGFADNGEQVWGPVAGPYRFRRRGEAACADPVLMLVHGEIFDRGAFGAYVGALAESGLYAKFQGYYRAISPVIDVFEGEPPPGRGVVLARFPCAEAARAFWNSPQYAQIKQLRHDAARFEVVLLRELPVADHVRW